MSMDYIRKTYGLCVKAGDRVIYSGCEPAREGTITGADGAHLRIRLDGEKRAWKFHPTWKLAVLAPNPLPGDH